MAVYDDVKRALQDILAPQLGEIRGEVATLRAERHARFAQVDARLSEIRSDMKSQFADVRQEIHNLHPDLVRIEQVFDTKFQAVGVVERITLLEERLART